ncbi:dynein heavy chain 3, axonemal-like [Pollicipes pollicipes]|uniref:dynein heavy chain 3, axonemal-like n=1 Tax=Pollicipes pollicipes TaxID=41117 RepID=UPI0018850CCF|nr:dynein heavy chain 3, axonemal-like [Pollicipes pollicipes]
MRTPIFTKDNKETNQEPFDLEQAELKFPLKYEESMNTVLKQELIRFNGLTAVIRSTLINVQKAVKGLVVMSSELEEVFNSMSVGKVPALWGSKSYPSLKPLGGYFTDLVTRLKVLQDWIDNDTPSVFWLSGFFFIHSFLTGILQNYARKKHISIDQLGFRYVVTQHEADAPEKPEDGELVKGLFLEGARWDRKAGRLAESLPKILFDTLPIIWLQPGIKSEFSTAGLYACPLYNTSARRGTLSTTGHSTNFVFFITLPSAAPPAHWINRGVAAICQLTTSAGRCRRRLVRRVLRGRTLNVPDNLSLVLVEFDILRGSDLADGSGSRQAEYTCNPDFDPTVIRNVSTACEGLCRWVRAMEVYDRVAKIVAPKKAKLAEAEGELAAQMDKLNEKRRQLQQVTDKLQALNDEFAAMTKKKRDLEDNIELCSQKLDRAEKLIGGLGGEKSRWSEAAETLTGRYDNIMGDVLLSAGVVAYLGPFTVDYRQEAVDDWAARCAEASIPCSAQFSLIATLGEPVRIRAWQIAGLPVDAFSIDNGIIVGNARRWPLMIDPQGQASKWVKNMERDNGLTVVKLTDPNYARTLENSLQFGKPMLIENVYEELDPMLEPVLQKLTYKQAGVDYIKLGESVLEYSPDFRLYITTRLRNPHYLPEIAVKVTLLNFMITPLGLEDQLLGIVAAKEKPDLEQKKNELIVEGANNQRLLKEIEDQILEVLSSSKGNILEDETAIQILSSSKVLSEEITAKQAVAAATEKEIDEARVGYRPVAVHSSTLFFCISELANIDPMYQYSLTWYIGLYLHSIQSSPKSPELKTRILALNDFFTRSIYRNVCRSLFEKDKLLFSCLLCVGIMKGRGELNGEQWRFFLTGGIALDNPYPNPASGWLTDKAWAEIVRLSSLEGFSKLYRDVARTPPAWKAIYDSSAPQEARYPGAWDEKTGLARMLLLRSMRPDKLIPAVQQFIVDNLGAYYIEPPTFDLPGSYGDSSCITPLIFFAEDEGQAGHVQTISLGQGQGPIAAQMIETALVEGGWVVLQNCHLATSWMPQLEMICENQIVPEKTHQRFRLWLTSYPSGDFPVSVLQNGVKMTNEPPKGLRANLLRSYLNDPISSPDFFGGCKQPQAWHRLLFGLCFFHGLVQERRQFGALGWNIPYEFNESDLSISMTQLQMFLNEYEHIPLAALTYLTGECNYGGRVTDDKDRRLLLSLLALSYNDNIINRAGYEFSPSGVYYVPDVEEHGEYVEYLRSLPMLAHPEVFGLHENADITKDNKETNQLLLGLLKTQPQQAATGGGGGSSAGAVTELAADLLSRLQEPFDLEQAELKFPLKYEESMNTVLKQELIRFNGLTAVIRSTLINVQKAVKGLVVMSSELEEVFNSMSVGKVPALWGSKSYPSLKPLGGYFTDLVTRLKVLQDWIDNDTPSVFWLSGFFFIHSFLTGILQNYARKKHISIDQLGFRYVVTQHEADAPEKPEDGELVKPSEECGGIWGLFLEGARWDRKAGRLAESLPKILFDTLPIIWLQPGIKSEFSTAGLYACPLYNTSARRGTLSTTGHSTNFVFFITLPSAAPPAHWINRGVAAICQLDD